MLTAPRQLLVVLGLLSVATCAIHATAHAQESAPSPTAAAVMRPFEQHTHYHYYYGMSPDNWLSPWSNPGSRPFVPTQAHPYPPSYVPGYYAPPPFPNHDPAASPSRGVIHVFLPAKNSLLYLNGVLLRGDTGKDRKINTPILPANQDYQYIVTASFQRDGENVTEYRKVVVGAGEYAVADFTRPAQPDPIKLRQGPIDPALVEQDADE